MDKKNKSKQLRGYFPLGAPLNWEPVTGNEPKLRVMVSFTVNWFHKRLGVSFGEYYHSDPQYRFETLLRMKRYIYELFPGIAYFKEHDSEGFDGECATISGLYGTCLIAMLYGLKPVFFDNNWPAISPDSKLSLDEIKRIKPLDLENNPVVEQLFRQMEVIHENWGVIDGYLNYQGVLNNAFKIRGSDIFLDMIDDPGLVRHIFGHITDTMIRLGSMVQQKQRESGFNVDNMCASNCVVNMISGEAYAEHVLPWDVLLSQAFGAFGMHSCNWVIDPYINAFAKIENIGYIDFGFDSDLERVGKTFKGARKHVFYTPSFMETKTVQEQRDDIRRICKTLGMCELSVADIEYSMPDDTVRRFVKLAETEVEAEAE
ncbi:MAG: hypothetical protein FWH55_03975 [Oscillospiraceae bacterium]|nr:hypothetical protein [Oscillospiraceae bacterium]